MDNEVEVPIIVGTGSLSLDILGKNDEGEDKTVDEIIEGGPPRIKPAVMFFLNQLHSSKFQREIEWGKIKGDGRNRRTVTKK